MQIQGGRRRISRRSEEYDFLLYRVFCSSCSSNLCSCVTPTTISVRIMCKTATKQISRQHSQPSSLKALIKTTTNSQTPQINGGALFLPVRHNRSLRFRSISMSYVADDGSWPFLLQSRVSERPKRHWRLARPPPVAPPRRSIACRRRHSHHVVKHMPTRDDIFPSALHLCVAYTYYYRIQYSRSERG